MRWGILAGALALALSGAASAETETFEQSRQRLGGMWDKNSEELKPVGRSQFIAIGIWLNGLELLGLCSARVSPEEVKNLLTWWDADKLRETPFGRSFFPVAAEHFSKGAANGAVQRPSLNVCAPPLLEWVRNLKQATSEI